MFDGKSENMVRVRGSSPQARNFVNQTSPTAHPKELGLSWGCRLSACPEQVGTHSGHAPPSKLSGDNSHGTTIQAKLHAN